MPSSYSVEFSQFAFRYITMWLSKFNYLSIHVHDDNTQHPPYTHTHTHQNEFNHTSRQVYYCLKTLFDIDWHHPIMLFRSWYPMVYAKTAYFIKINQLNPQQNLGNDTWYNCIKNDIFFLSFHALCLVNRHGSLVVDDNCISQTIMNVTYLSMPWSLLINKCCFKLFVSRCISPRHFLSLL